MLVISIEISTCVYKIFCVNIGVITNIMRMRKIEIDNGNLHTKNCLQADRIYMYINIY